MKRELIAILAAVLLSVLPTHANPLNRLEPVNSAKASLGLMVLAPEGIGYNLGIEAPLFLNFSLGGELAYFFTLPQSTGSRRKDSLLVNVVLKPRIRIDDRFETYVKTLIGPAFQFTRDVAFGMNLNILPGVQFSMSQDLGMYTELGFGLTHYPRLSETSYNGVFRLGMFYSF